MNIGLMWMAQEIAQPTFRCHGKQSVKIGGADVNFVQTWTGTAAPARDIGGVTVTYPQLEANNVT